MCDNCGCSGQSEQANYRQVRVDQLQMDPLAVIRSLIESHDTALVTLRGRFIAKIVPLTEEEEGALTGELINAWLVAEDAAGRLDGEGRIFTTEELAAKLGIELPEGHYPDRDVEE